jgi:hypothetical protein
MADVIDLYVYYFLYGAFDEIFHGVPGWNPLSQLHSLVRLREHE